MHHKIGFIGLGLMGAPMAAHVLKQRGELWVWNRSPDKLVSLVDQGATPVNSPREMAGKVDVIALCITDVQAVQHVLWGADGVMASSKKGLILIDHSTLAPPEAIMFKQRADLHAMHYLDAPVTGSVPGAVNGTLSVFVGGDETIYHSISSVLSAYGKRLCYMGPSGSGQATKMCNQVMLHNTICATFETLHFAKQQGLDVEKCFSALEDSLIDSKAWRIFGGAAIQAEPARLAHVRDVMKDIRSVQATAREAHSPLYLYDVVAELVQQLMGQGLAAEDIVSLSRHYDKAPR